MKKTTSTNAENEQYLKSVCPMQHAMEQLSGRWKILLLWYIHLGLNRFSLMQRRIPKITTKMLSQQLRELEESGLLTRTIYPEMPPRVEYALTEKSLSLVPVFLQFNEWGKQDMKE